MVRVSMIPNEPIVTLKCSQGDIVLRAWEFSLYANDKAVTPLGTYTLICENGARVPLTIEGNTLLCDCTAELSATAGRYLAKIKNEHGSELLYSSLLNILVEVKP